MRKALGILVCLFLLFGSFSFPTFADDGNEKIIIRLNNGIYNFDVEPFIKDGRTMVPFRGIFEAFGANVSWDNDNRCVTAVLYERVMKLKADSTEAEIDGVKFVLDTPPLIVNSRTFVPLRFISESLGYTVKWDEKNRTVDIFTVTPQAYEQLEKLRASFGRDFIKWLASMYDIETGGFYYAASARDHIGFSADIESTSQALNIMDTSKLKPASKTYTEFLGKDFADKIINYIQSRQDEETGYFFDPQFEKDLTNSTKLERNLVQAQVMHTRFEAEPKFEYPVDRALQNSSSSSKTQSALPEHMQSAEKFEAWMKALPWKSSPYAAANQLSTQQYTAEGLGYGPMICEYLKSIQNPMTGLWGNALDYEALNATLKVSVYFHDKSEKYPNMEKMIDSLVYILTTSDSPPQTASETWNPITLLNNARISYGGKYTAAVKRKLDENMDKILAWAVDQLNVFRKEDGGFSYSRQMSTAYSQGATVSLGLAEGDMNASMLLLNLWEKCHAVAGMPTPPLYSEDDGKYFLELLDEVKVPEKKEIDPLVYSQDFESVTQKTILETGYSIRGPEGIGAIVQDPDQSKVKDNVFRLTSNENASVANMIVMGMVADKKDLKKITFEADIMMSDISDGLLWYNTLHNTRSGTAVQWLLVGDSDQFSINIRSTSGGLGIQAGDLLDTDTWYNMRIEYEPRGMTDTVIRVFIDEELVLTTNQYSGFGSREPTKSLDCSILNSVVGTQSSLYFNNIKLFVE